MKTLSVPLPDEVYERAERRTADHGVSLPHEIAELIKRYGQKGGLGLEAQDVEQPGKDGVLAELAKTAEECSSANWNCEAAAPVDETTLRRAQEFVRALPPDCPLPAIGVEPDGHLTMEWYRSPRWTFSVSVSPKSELYYAALFGASDVRGREEFRATVPGIILSLIGRVFEE